MNKFFVLLTGVGIGSVATYFITKKVLTERMENEIQSVKDAFYNIQEEEKKSIENLENKEKDADNAIKEYGNTEGIKVDADSDNRKTDASSTSTSSEPVQPVQNVEGKDKKHLVPKEGEPYCISMDEVGESVDGVQYEIEYLTYYADGVLAYDDGEVIRHPDEVVGKGNLYHFGEFEPDMLYVRDPVEYTDYSIQLSEDNYHT